MKHKFYIKSKKERNQIQVWIGIIAFTLILIFLVISWKTETYLLAILTIPITLSIIAPFFDTPSLKKSGGLIYYSPLFLSEKPKNGLIKIHGGTLFDYVFVIDLKLNGKQRTNFIIQQYLEGLLNLIEEKENNNCENINVRGTSYIINDRTAQRMGFTIVKTDYIQKLILIYNYFNVLIAYSIAKGKLSFPNLNETKTFVTTLNDLIERKEFIGTLNEKLKNTITNKVQANMDESDKFK
ncbi:hypothetical protein MWU65_13650 [Cellulophaga sp. F20128]|uniref:hypothetical protein n=1 Tax=Cellulophaga sp. F20128 TaxID=2926413 RepID=UPI001FF5092E|nr:hypothetical protein [Cellulophaga sp. F20128]MCK0158234.1 hypothetical protein [Cellulophaga sp. F20128]